MAKYTGSVREALNRWRKPHIHSIDTEAHSTNGLQGASVSIRSATGEVTLIVTSVAVESGAGQLDEVYRSFELLTHAPSDAAMLASEVERLTAQVADLKIASGPSPPGTTGDGGE
ncbi:MAG TPA: hypothetical protein VK611_25120 [Acidimicrobiales bacterium]|nr:hypothetical protein [Acidimicrobiales bacterium]